MHCKVCFTHVFWPKIVHFFCLRLTQVVVGVLKFLHIEKNVHVRHRILNEHKLQLIIFGSILNFSDVFASVTLQQMDVGASLKPMDATASAGSIENDGTFTRPSLGLKRYAQPTIRYDTIWWTRYDTLRDTFAILTWEAEACDPGLRSEALHSTDYNCLRSNDAQWLQQWRPPRSFKMQCVCDEFTHFIGIYWLFSVVSRVRFQLWHVLHLYRIVSSSVYCDTYHSLCIGDIPVYHFSPIRHGVNNISHVCWSDGKLMTKFKFKFDTDKDTSGRVHVMDQTVETGPWWGCQVFLVTTWIIPSYGLGRIWRKTNTNANHMMIWNHSTNGYGHTSNISCTLEGNKFVDHRDVIGASPVDAATTTSPFLTWHLVSMDWAKTTARREKNIYVLWFGVPYIRGLTVVTNRIQHKYNLAGLLRKNGSLDFSFHQ